MANCPQLESRKINKFLDEHGLSTSFIDYRRKICAGALLDDNINSFFVAGSKREAVCPFLDPGSDLDCICVLPISVVWETESSNVEHFSNNNRLPVFSLEKGLKPGYKYLRCLTNKFDGPLVAQFRGYKYAANTVKEAFLAADDDKDNWEIHGPALSNSSHFSDGQHLEYDGVLAFHCASLPGDFDEWCKRKRDYGWPPGWIIDETKKYGCLLVGVGHYASPTKQIEWRLSLTKTEYLLTKSFNHTQMKCYALLKLVLKWIIQPQSKEALSSYHVKTVMFWMSEEHEKEFWRPINLVECFMCSLVKLRTYVIKKCCPNYFLTKVNLFEGKLEGRIHQKVVGILDDIIAEGPSVAYRCLPLNAQMSSVRYDNCMNDLDQSLHQLLLNKRLEEIAATETLFNQHCSFNDSMYRTCHFALNDWHNVNESNNKSSIYSLTFSSIAVLEGMGLPNKHLYSLQKKWIAKLLGQNYIARIKLATLFYYRRRLGYCVHLLSLVIKSLESSCEFEVCKEGEVSARHVEIEGVECIYLSQSNNGFRVSEIVFSPCDQLLIPPDLQNEMRRPKTVNGTHYEGWVFVDSIVYAYYLLIVTLHDMRQYSSITSLFRRFHKVYTQQPGAIRIFRKEMAKRLYEHAFMLVWAATKGFTRVST